MIREGQYTFIRMPSDNVKMVMLKKDQTVNMGKFGSFKVNDILDQPYGHSYEVLSKGMIRRASPKELDEEEEWDGANNKLIGQGNDAQKLTQAEIEVLKAKGLTEEGMDTEIVDSHTSFQLKTEFSKAKYMNRKRQKFGKIFTPMMPGIRTVCNYFYQKNPTKIMDVRMDTLSQALTMLNAHAHSRLLVVDDAQGMFVASLLERLGGYGEVVGIHSGEYCNYDVIRYMNLPKAHQSILKTVSWARSNPLTSSFPFLLADVIEDKAAQAPIGEGRDWTEKERQERQVIIEERRKVRLAALKSLRETLSRGQFDGLLIATQMDASDIMTRLLPYLSGSRPIVLYSPHKETLLKPYALAKDNSEYLNPSLHEPWLREYQVLPGRTHPTMSTTGSGGFLLSTLKVIDCPAEAVGHGKKRAKSEEKAGEEQGPIVDTTEKKAKLE
ncbi:MAG: Gcd10p family-domain-containing protein [Piptocephalis tieghemiana]|nr:MAG: Gcd10p family-domain-containing protein [Piptocephalis tieghemiana]